MREKIIECLMNATQWLTAQLVADQVGSRSAANMSVYLRELAAGGEVVRSTRSEGGITVAEYRHRSRPDVEAYDASRKKPKPSNVVALPPAEAAEIQLAEWKKMAGKFGLETPRAMAIFVGKLQRKAA